VSVAGIFVSYTSQDREWANWIGLELEALGHVAHIDNWEVSAGGNIMAWMEKRHDEADHLLCIVSETYLKKPYSSLERQAGQWAAVTTRPNFVLPVFIEPCEAPTLLAPLKRCDLYDLGEKDARARLKSFLAPAAKPTHAPFPGSVTRAPAAFPGKVPRDNQGEKTFFQTLFVSLMGQTVLFMGLLAIYFAIVAALYAYAKAPLQAFRDDLGAPRAGRGRKAPDPGWAPGEHPPRCGGARGWNEAAPTPISWLTRSN
jgi:TIR domain